MIREETETPAGQRRLAEWERAKVPDGYRDITAGLTKMFRSKIPAHIRGVSFKVIPKRLLPAPGVCVTETRHIYIAHDLVSGIKAEDFAEPEALLAKRARALGVVVHEILHARFSPLDWAGWIKQIERTYLNHAKVIPATVALEEIRIEAWGVRTTGLLIPAEKAALAEMADELVARGLSKGWAE